MGRLHRRAVLVLGMLGCTGEDKDCDLCAGGCEETIQSRDASHETGYLDYDDPPPTGGDHNPCWAAWGVHSEEVRDEFWVHNLEHGGVAFLYNCPEGCADDVATLEGYVLTLGPTALLTPYAALPTRYAAVAWEHRLLQDCLDLGAMQAFYQDHVDNGPESSTSSPSEGCMGSGDGG